MPGGTVTGEIRRKKKVTISVEMNDILPSQRDKSLERDPPEGVPPNSTNPPLTSVYGDEEQKEGDPCNDILQRVNGGEEDTPEKNRKMKEAPPPKKAQTKSAVSYIYNYTWVSK
jgi:hypothetical protein